jgi:hypothetical protein
MRWVYAQHNARVLIDFENRMSAVICEATGHVMSKSYYTVEAMLSQIAEHHSRLYDDAYAEGRRDTAEEFGIELPPEAHPPFNTPFRALGDCPMNVKRPPNSLSRRPF